MFVPPPLPRPSRRVAVTLAVCLLGYAQLPAAPVIDLDGNGRNDLWELYFETSLLASGPGHDDDGDGRTDEAEAAGWSDPRNPDEVDRPDRRIDTDQDGLTDFEETLLGLDPTRACSAPHGSGGDLAYAVARLSTPGEITLGGHTVRIAGPSLASSARFLMHATLGGDSDEIREVSETGFAPWLEAQFQVEPTVTWKEVYEVIAQHKPYDLHHAWWRAVLTSPDRLRQRVATAMTEIYVISEQSINFVPWEMMEFYDNLGVLSFGNWRDLIEHVSLSPLMGYYLSHLKNQKADPALDRYPDENYAREVMQLFSIGLWELNPDGTHQRDADGQEIPTYDNTTITNFARVFTGLGFGGGDVDPTVPQQFFDAPLNYSARMKLWEDQHDQEAKYLLRGTVLPAFADAPGRTGMDDIHDALDNLFNHPNVGPFVGRLLIQRLVKSNPSPDYIRRVAFAFADNGEGVRGDLKAVLKAILLDPEARNPPATDDPAAGHLRESYLRYVRLAKTFRARSAEGSFKINDRGTLVDISQTFYNSPSVFNFFLPDYRPAGLLADADLVAPEFQIMNSTTAITTLNLYQQMIASGFGDVSDGPETMRLDFSEELPLAGDPEALIDHLNLKMAAGELSPATRAVLRRAYDDLPAEFDARQRVAAIVQLIVVSPDWAVLE